MTKKLLLICGVMILFTACDSSPKSVEYYKEHQDEAKAKLKNCNERREKGKSFSQNQI